MTSILAQVTDSEADVLQQTQPPARQACEVVVPPAADEKSTASSFLWPRLLFHNISSVRQAWGHISVSTRMDQGPSMDQWV